MTNLTSNPFSEEPRVKCQICNLAMPESFELTSLPEAGPLLTIHEECKLCHYCNKEVTPHYLKAFCDQTERPMVYHQICRNQALEQDFKQKPVIITQEHLDYLNRSHLFMQQVMHSNDDLSIESNQEISERMITPWFTELDLEGKFKALKNFEAVCARMSIALSKDKNAIQTRIQAREIERYKEVQEIRDGQVTRKETNRMKSLTEIEKDNEKANPQLKARRKAIEGFMKVGMSEQAATQAVDGANKPN